MLYSKYLVAFFFAELTIRGVVLRIFGCVFCAELAIRGVVLKIFGRIFLAYLESDIAFVSVSNSKSSLT